MPGAEKPTRYTMVVCAVVRYRVMRGPVEPDFGPATAAPIGDAAHVA
jgi:hypothetical protein